MPGNSLLIIDSNRSTLEMTSDYLKSEGFSVIADTDADSALSGLESGVIDAAICSSQACLEKLVSLSVPVIVYTDRGSIDDKIRAYEAGCDDYLVYPCDIRELKLRINACLKRTSRDVNMVLDYSPLSMNIKTREVFLDGKNVRLTNREFEILSYLAETPNKTVSIKEIYSNVWGDDTECDNHLVMVNVSYIRKKFSVILPDIDFISTKWGVGYYFAYPPVKNR